MTKIVVFILLYCLFIPNCFAVRVAGLYQAETEVTDKHEQTRNQAVQTALKIVLVKLTGDRSAALRPDLIGIVNNANKYVQQFSYRESREIVDDEGTVVPTLKLKIRFDDATLSNDLRNAGVGLWGNERPAILVWLLVQQDNRRIMASLEETPELMEALYRRAEQRGISLIFPLMDLQDSSAIQPSDIWGGFKEPVLSASQRYNPDIVLTGNVSSPFAGLWQSDWVSYDSDQSSLSWNTESDLLELVLDEGLDVLVDSLAVKYAPDGELGSFRLFVNSVFSVDDYARLLNYLSSLSAIKDVNVIQVDADQVTLSLTAHGGDRAIAQAISLGRVLQTVNGAQANSYEMLP